MYLIPDVTKEIRLYGLNDDDVFEMDENASSKIKVRIIGGKGNDTFNIDGKVKSELYDLNSEKNLITGTNKKISDNTSGEPSVNAYSPTGYTYDINRFPRMNFGYNIEDGLMVGVSMLRRTHSFRKEPFATEHRLSTLYAISHGSYLIRYNGQFNEVLGKFDVLPNLSFVNPVLNNFFGLGNETKKDPEKSLDFYRVRYKYVQADVLLRKRLNQILHVSGGPMIYHYWNKYEDNSARILAKPELIGLDSSSVYSQKTYLGGKMGILINNLDNVLLPTRGINWYTEFTAQGGLSETSKPFTSLVSHMDVHAAVSDPAKLVAVLRVGGGHIIQQAVRILSGVKPWCK